MVKSQNYSSAVLFGTQALCIFHETRMKKFKTMMKIGKNVAITIHFSSSRMEDGILTIDKGISQTIYNDDTPGPIIKLSNDNLSSFDGLRV